MDDKQKAQWQKRLDQAKKAAGHKKPPDSRPCKLCGAPIVFVKMKTGRTMPCDARVLTVITRDGRTIRGRESHFATCPHADDFRKGGK